MVSFTMLVTIRFFFKKKKNPMFFFMIKVQDSYLKKQRNELGIIEFHYFLLQSSVKDKISGD